MLEDAKATGLVGAALEPLAFAAARPVADVEAAKTPFVPKTLDYLPVGSVPAVDVVHRDEVFGEEVAPFDLVAFPDVDRRRGVVVKLLRPGLEVARIKTHRHVKRRCQRKREVSDANF